MNEGFAASPALHTRLPNGRRQPTTIHQKVKAERRLVPPERPPARRDVALSSSPPRAARNSRPTSPALPPPTIRFETSAPRPRALARPVSRSVAAPAPLRPSARGERASALPPRGAASARGRDRAGHASRGSGFHAPPRSRLPWPPARSDHNVTMSLSLSPCKCTPRRLEKYLRSYHQPRNRRRASPLPAACWLTCGRASPTARAADLRFSFIV